MECDSRFLKEAVMSHAKFWPSDDQLERIAPHLPRDTRGKPRVDDRRVISGNGIRRFVEAKGTTPDIPP